MCIQVKSYISSLLVFMCQIYVSIPGLPEKAERWIFSTLRAKSIILFTSLDQTSSAEENDTKIVKFGWVVLILCPFLERMGEELCLE